MNVVKSWFKGLLTLIAVAVVGIVGFLFLALFGFAIDTIYFVIFIVFAIIVIFTLPYYIGKQKQVRSKKYELKKVKKA